MYRIKMLTIVPVLRSGLTWSCPCTLECSDWSCLMDWCAAWNQAQSIQNNHCMGALKKHYQYEWNEDGHSFRIFHFFRLSYGLYKIKKHVQLLWYTVWNVCVQGNSGLIGPAACHIADGVSSTAQHEQREVERLHVLHTLCMAWWKQKILCITGSFPLQMCVSLCACAFTTDGEVKAAEAISWQRVGAALKNHGTGPVHFHHLCHHLQVHSTEK